MKKKIIKTRNRNNQSQKKKKKKKKKKLALKGIRFTANDTKHINNIQAEKYIQKKEEGKKRKREREIERIQKRKKTNKPTCDPK